MSTSASPPGGPSAWVARLLGQWFGCGLSPLAPGTVGSAGALPFYFLLAPLPAIAYWGVTALVTVLGVWSSQRCAELLGEKDPSSVVIDEVAGVLIALGFLRGQAPLALAATWLLFRALDIWKPWLIDRAQYLPPEGVGIMADDVLAGLVAGLVGWGGLAVWIRSGHL